MLSGERGIEHDEHGNPIFPWWRRLLASPRGLRAPERGVPLPSKDAGRRTTLRLLDGGGDKREGEDERVRTGWLIPPDRLHAEISHLSRASERAGGGPLGLVDTGVRRDGLALVRIEGAPVSLGSWEIVAVLHHETQGTRVEPCGPLPRSQLERLRDARALCEACRTVRSRKQTWLLRERSSAVTRQVGSSCLKPLTGATSIHAAVGRAQALANAAAVLSAASTRLARHPQAEPGDAYIPPTRFLAHAVAVVRQHRFAPASEPDPTWRRALALLEAGVEPSDTDVRRALEIQAWARAPADEVNEYRVRLADCLERERLSSRELSLAASAVRTYNLNLYRVIRRKTGRRAKRSESG